MPRPCKLTFDLLTLKVVSESRVTWANSELADRHMGGATGRCGGSMSPSLLGPGGYRGVQGGGPMKMIFASTADSFCSVLYK